MQILMITLCKILVSVCYIETMRCVANVNKFIARITLTFYFILTLSPSPRCLEMIM